MSGPWYLDWLYRVEAHTVGPFKTLDDALRHMASVATLRIEAFQGHELRQIILRNDE